MSAYTGYRTFIVAALLAISGIAARYGFKFDPAAVADAAIIAIPAAMALMRTVTRTPIRKSR